MNDDLLRLRELTYQLSSHPNDKASYMPSMVEYTIPDGISFGTALYSKPGVAVQEVVMSAGSTFPPHVHDGHEWVITYQGRYILHLEGKPDREVGIGGYAYFPPGQGHSGTILENTRIISISVPADPGYPDVAQ